MALTLQAVGGTPVEPADTGSDNTSVSSPPPDRVPHDEKVTTAAGVKRDELSRFLRARRARVTPEAAGIEPGPRRRTAGLRREELAQLAGVGITWYTWLEQGRPINASTQVLDAIARVLELGTAERWHLYRLAEVPGVPVAPRSCDCGVPPDAVAVLDTFTDYPACIYDGRFNLLASNNSYNMLFPVLVAKTGADRNVLRAIAAAGPAAPVNDELLGKLIGVLRTNYATHIGEPHWEELIAYLTTTSPAIARHWSSHDVSLPGRQIKEFACPPVGLVRFNTLSYTIDGADQMRMVVHMPDSAADAAKVRELEEFGGVRF